MTSPIDPFSYPQQTEEGRFLRLMAQSCALTVQAFKWHLAQHCATSTDETGATWHSISRPELLNEVSSQTADFIRELASWCISTGHAKPHPTNQNLVRATTP